MEFHMFNNAVLEDIGVKEDLLNGTINYIEFPCANHCKSHT